MRLVNTKTLELQEFTELNVPKYAILSHMWDKEEVSYQDMLRGDDAVKEMKGYGKICKSAELAASREYTHVWVDTCCIDKTSSAELSDAINSMYRWYKNAQVCFAYLQDVGRWFSRGWTLQELIAPREVIFYSRTWQEIGTKVTLHGSISRITGIDGDILTSGDTSTASVAERMCWASKRQTRRKEDEAYCLMGIFDVNMPMVYGEGARAFTRLQEEIMKNSDDHSIFAWKDDTASRSMYRGLLATSPADFRDSGGVFPRDYFSALEASPTPYSTTNKGLGIDLPLASVEGEPLLYLALLDCCDKEEGQLGIFLKRLSVDDNQYARVDVNKFGYLTTLPLDDVPSQKYGIYIRQHVRFPVTARIPVDRTPITKIDNEQAMLARISRFVLSPQPPDVLERNKMTVQWPHDQLDAENMRSEIPYGPIGENETLVIKSKSGVELFIAFGIIEEESEASSWNFLGGLVASRPVLYWTPWCEVLELPDASDSKKESAKSTREFHELGQTVTATVEVGVFKNEVVLKLVVSIDPPSFVNVDISKILGDPLLEIIPVAPPVFHGATGVDEDMTGFKKEAFQEAISRLET
ncbi:hypothetical protein G7046_g4983 [Stylonectria norvegica]|nr:hypothetical protein G7046_g4983 [Stylonectria norvegica]